MTDAVLAALTTIQSYRYLTATQVATMAGLNKKSTADMLLRLERHGLLGAFGNVGVRGLGKTPKVYFLKRRGHRLLGVELEAASRPVPKFTEVNIATRWSPLMYHRLATIDVLSWVERDVRSLASYELLGTLVEYRREKVAGRWRSETTDYVADGHNPAERIIPDAGFALRHRETDKRALFLIEVDRGTMRLSSAQPDDDIDTYTAKFNLYDRYLASGRVRDRYPRLGSFTGFHVLTITTSDARVENMRAAARLLDPAYHPFHRLSTLDRVRQNLLHDGWLSRDHADPSTYKLIKGS